MAQTYVIEHWHASYFGSRFRRLGLQFNVLPWHSLLLAANFYQCSPQSGARQTELPPLQVGGIDQSRVVSARWRSVNTDVITWRKASAHSQPSWTKAADRKVAEPATILNQILDFINLACLWVNPQLDRFNKRWAGKPRQCVTPIYSRREIVMEKSSQGGEL